jgi:hypothetical protein
VGAEGGRARTFEGNTRVLCALNPLFDDAKLGLRQLLAVGGESALVLLVNRQALPGPETKCNNLGLYGFDCSAQFIVVFDSFQVRDSRPAGFHLVAERLERLEKLLRRKLKAGLLNLGLKSSKFLQ